MKEGTTFFGYEWDGPHADGNIDVECPDRDYWFLARFTKEDLEQMLKAFDENEA